MLEAQILTKLTIQLKRWCEYLPLNIRFGRYNSVATIYDDAFNLNKVLPTSSIEAVTCSADAILHLPNMHMLACNIRRNFFENACLKTALALPPSLHCKPTGALR
jgi:hypothetical protein